MLRLFLLAVMSGFLASGASAQWFQAPAVQPPSIGNQPGWLVFTDVNNDSRDDVVTTNTNPNGVTVSLRLPSGAFAPPVSYAITGTPNVMAVDYLNNDSFQDIVLTTNVGGTIDRLTVLFNDGSGGFSGAPLTLSVGNNPVFVAVADWSGDGHPDFAAINFDSDTISLFSNNGEGLFLAVAPLPTCDQPNGLAIADLNNDGKLDFAVACAAGNVISIRLNSGGGVLMNPVIYPVGSSQGGRRISAGDLNGDGFRDLAVSNYDGHSVSILLNNGNGTFAEQIEYGVGYGPRNIVICKLDDDPFPEVVTANQWSHSISILRNHGNGTFAAQSMFGSCGTMCEPRGLVCTNYDGDERLDILTANQGSDNVLALTNLGASSAYISEQPSNITVALGESAMFHVVAGGSGQLEYEWRKGGIIIGADPKFSGAMTDSLAVSTLSPDAAGVYDVIVTDSNSSVTTRAATLELRSQCDEVRSGFETSSEGWTLVGEQPPTASPFWNAEGGHTGGFLQGRDIDSDGDGVMYWRAPQSFRGSLSNAYGGSLQYDLQQSTTSNQINLPPDIILQGGGLTLVYNTPVNPLLTPAWRSYSVPLVADTGWRMDTLGGLVPTIEQFEAALSSITDLRIRAEFSQFSRVGIDNVRIKFASDEIHADLNGDGIVYLDDVALLVSGLGSDFDLSDFANLQIEFGTYCP